MGATTTAGTVKAGDTGLPGRKGTPVSVLERSLSKLILSAWKDREGKIPAGELSVMYNPDTLRLDYRTRFIVSESINQIEQINDYVMFEPTEINLELVFDARMPGHTIPVETQLATLKSLCAVDAATQEPYYLKVTWGRMRWENKGYFAGRVSALSVNYTLFDRDATALRATAQLTLVADESFKVQEAENKLQSPDKAWLSVPDLATLPLLAAHASGILGEHKDYLDLAWENNLDHLDQLIPGETLQASKGGGRG